MRIKEIINESIKVKQALLEDLELVKRIEQTANAIIECYRRGGRVYFCGNGGSAADSQHLAAELSGRFYFDRPALAAEALHVNTSYLTAVANDYGYERVFARAVEAFCTGGDVLIGLSTSGNSANILRAFETAKSKGVTLVALTGRGGGKMADLCDILLNVPSEDTPRIQESHIMIGHILCEIVETTLFENQNIK